MPLYLQIREGMHAADSKRCRRRSRDIELEQTLAVSGMIGTLRLPPTEV